MFPTDLCAELLGDIGRQLDEADQKHFRLVCVDLRRAMDPIFYSSFHLKTDQLRLDYTRAILEAIVKNEIGWSRYTKTLTITIGKIPQPEVKTEYKPDGVVASKTSLDLLSAALLSMKNIETVLWDIADSVAIPTICGVLNNLPHLAHLELQLRRLDVKVTDLPLAQVSGLRALKVSTPSGSSLDTQSIWRLIRQNRGLTTVHLFGESQWAKVWTAVRAQINPSIRLKDVATNLVTTDLLTYLASYDGVESLRLQTPDGRNRHEADAFADIFCEQVLPRHTNSLVYLSCPSAYESRWSFGVSNADVVARLHELEYLEMSVDAGELLNVEPTSNAVTILLETLPRFPKLRVLEIYYAGSQAMRGQVRMMPIYQHNNSMKLAIAQAIQDFRTRVQSDALVRASQRTYELGPVEGLDLSSLTEGTTPTSGSESAAEPKLLAYHCVEDLLCTGGLWEYSNWERGAPPVLQLTAVRVGPTRS
ncbi:hypothetical protein C8R43DRAFT_1027552 [Mycena crocata]|nr:hypothetical protein C8R43DRAFT_1027552 [Mycena crocata]